jgi:hypothetical protein
VFDVCVYYVCVSSVRREERSFAGRTREERSQGGARCECVVESDLDGGQNKPPPGGARARRNVRKRMDGLYAAHHDRGHVGPRSRGTAVTHHDRGHVGRVSPRAQSVMCVATRTRDRERERERERDASSSSSSAAAARRADSSAWHETIHREAGFGGPSQVYTGGPGPGFYRPFLTRDPGTRVAPSQHNIQVWFGPSCHGDGQHHVHGNWPGNT